VEPVDLATVLRTALSEHSFQVWGATSSRSRPRRPTRPPRSASGESAVLDAVARGLSNREIGRQLWISEQTVKFHLRNVYRKLGISAAPRRAVRLPHRDASPRSTVESPSVRS
jgi:DNA-binding NarL/FixJ family response regulator